MTFITEFLRTVPYFDMLDDTAIHQLTAQMIRRRFSANETIFVEGTPTIGMWIIERGRVKITKINPDGEELILRLMGEGNLFNDIGALDGDVNPANAIALTDATLWILPSNVLNTLVESNPKVARRTIQLLAGRVRSLVTQIEDLALYSVTIRVARFLLKQEENPALQGVARAAVASHLATTPESVSRSLRALETAGAIAFDRQTVIIHDRDLLKTIAAL